MPLLLEQKPLLTGAALCTSSIMYTNQPKWTATKPLQPFKERPDLTPLMYTSMNIANGKSLRSCQLEHLVIWV